MQDRLACKDKHVTYSLMEGEAAEKQSALKVLDHRRQQLRRRPSEETIGW